MKTVKQVRGMIAHLSLNLFRPKDEYYRFFEGKIDSLKWVLEDD